MCVVPPGYDELQMASVRAEVAAALAGHPPPRFVSEHVCVLAGLLGDELARLLDPRSGCGDGGPPAEQRYLVLAVGQHYTSATVAAVRGVYRHVQLSVLWTDLIATAECVNVRQ